MHMTSAPCRLLNEQNGVMYSSVCVQVILPGASPSVALPRPGTWSLGFRCCVMPNLGPVAATVVSSDPHAMSQLISAGAGDGPAARAGADIAKHAPTSA